MGISLETRVPFLNEDIIKFAWTLPNSMKVKNGMGKYILRSLLADNIPKKLFDRPKQGFAVPIEHWLRGPLLEWAESLLNKSKLDEQGYLNSKIIREKWDEHKSGKKNWQTDLWNVLMFQAWLEDQ
jgi:asparagine synthase (glutamine-hydrolysing)